MCVANSSRLSPSLRWALLVQLLFDCAALQRDSREMDGFGQRFGLGKSMFKLRPSYQQNVPKSAHSDWLPVALEGELRACLACIPSCKTLLCCLIDHFPSHCARFRPSTSNFQTSCLFHCPCLRAACAWCRARKRRARPASQLTTTTTITNRLPSLSNEADEHIAGGSNSGSSQPQKVALVLLACGGT